MIQKPIEGAEASALPQPPCKLWHHWEVIDMEIDIAGPPSMGGSVCETRKCKRCGVTADRVI